AGQHAGPSVRLICRRKLTGKIRVDWQWRGRNQQHAAYSIGAVTDPFGAFDYLEVLGNEGVYLRSVLGTPLLSFLADAIIEDQDAVTVHSVDDGLGNTRACL